ncbi:MAG: serine protease [Lachnospiraceae bacterium]|nr:serine protease [Lachnospiraceae bacterium]
MKNLNKIFILVMAIFVMCLYSDAIAQSRKGYINAQSNTQAVEKYFRDNIMLLDPIEGAYSVEQITKSWNNYMTFPDNVDNYYEIIVKNGSKFICLGNPSTSFERIGDTNVYNCKFKLNSPDGDLWFSQRVVLQNGALFTISKTLPIPGNVVGAKYKLTMTFIKDYPTASIYEEALESEIQRRQHELDKQAEPTDWSGSGFALNNGYICTNYHVVEGARSIEILGVQGDFTISYSAKVVATDKFNDLALLQIDDSKFKGFGTIPYKVKTSMAEVGESIFVLGYPMTTTMGDEIKLTNGIISSRTGFQGDVSLYQISAPIQPGNSGGPLFDNYGNLIGIVSAKHEGAENVGYAIKASYLRNLMESSIIEDVLPTNNSISSLPLTGKVQKVKNYVYFIKCSSK